jgi:hypothetical protein
MVLNRAVWITSRTPACQSRCCLRAMVRKPVPLFEFQWGMLELGMVPAEEDAPVGIEVTLYVKQTLNDTDLLSCLSEVLPDELG